MKLEAQYSLDRDIRVSKTQYREELKTLKKELIEGFDRIMGLLSSAEHDTLGGENDIFRAGFEDAERLRKRVDRLCESYFLEVKEVHSADLSHLKSQLIKELKYEWAVDPTFFPSDPFERTERAGLAKQANTCLDYIDEFCEKHWRGLPTQNDNEIFTTESEYSDYMGRLKSKRIDRFFDFLKGCDLEIEDERLDALAVMERLRGRFGEIKGVLKLLKQKDEEEDKRREEEAKREQQRITRRPRKLLTWLKERSLSHFGYLEDFDLDDEDDREEALIIAEGLGRGLGEFCDVLSDGNKDSEEHYSVDHETTVSNSEYQESLKSLKKEFMDEFKVILRILSNFPDSEDFTKQSAFNLTERLRRLVDRFCDYLSVGKKETQGTKLENLQVSIAGLENYWAVEEEQDDGIRLVMKDENSYLVWEENEGGFKIKENGTQLFFIPSAKDNDGSRLYSLEDAIYFPPLNCYLLAAYNRLYRKDIDSKPPYLMMGVELGGLKSGHSLIYSKIHKRVLSIKDRKNILVINPMAKEVEIEVEKTVRGSILEFKLFGEQEDRVVAVTTFGQVLLYELNYQEKTGSLKAKEDLIKIESKICLNLPLAVCLKNKYCCVRIRNPTPSPMKILQVNSDSFVEKGIIDSSSIQEGSTLGPLECYCYMGSHILWVWIAKKDGLVHVYDYNTETGDFMELEDKRVEHLGYEPKKMVRFGGKFYYPGENNVLMRLSLD